MFGQPKHLCPSICLALETYFSSLFKTAYNFLVFLCFVSSLGGGQESWFREEGV